MRELILSFYQELDSSIDALSLHYEHHITGLPSWVLNKRSISVGKYRDSKLYIIKVDVNPELETDNYLETTYDNLDQVTSILGPIDVRNILINPPQENYNLMLGDPLVIEGNNPYAEPVYNYNGLIALITEDKIPIEFSDYQAKKEAIEHWNNAVLDLPKSTSLIVNLDNIFS